MKRFAIKTSKILGLTLLILFLSAFVWANWSKPTLGEKAASVNFIPYSVAGLDSTKVVEIERAVNAIEGVKVSAFNMTSEILSVGYLIDVTDKQEIENTIQKQFNFSLKEKIFENAGPKCPVDGPLNALASFKKALCFRD